VRWSEKDFDGESLYNYLKFGIRKAQVMRMKAEVDRVACWFDYDMFDNPHCSPYIGVVKNLKEKLKFLPH